MNANCPKCGSKQTRSRVALHESGTRLSERNSGFFGISSRGGWFGGATSSAGKSQSLLSKRAGPNVGVLPGLLFLGTVVAFGMKSYVVAFALLLVSIPIILAANRKTTTYEKEWICLRCGQEFVPNLASTTQRDIVPRATTPASTSLRDTDPQPMLMNSKQCSISGTTKTPDNFNYGNREDRSYCKQCSSEEKAAYSWGGKEAARAYRESKRQKWRKT